MHSFPWLSWSQTQRLIAAFAAADAPLRFVGGAVRDALIEREVLDVDAATPATPEAVIALLQQAGIKVIPTGLAHGTVTAAIEGRNFEITTLRKDVATDGRHAEVEYTDDWRQDAQRRDFTINALYLSPQGELFDYFGGEQDLANGIVRFIGDAATRISEDYLRILRFFRFYARYGKAAPDKEALKACKAAADQMGKLSGERIRQELLKLLSAANAAKTVKLMQQSRVLPYALGFPVQDNAMMARFEAIEQALVIAIEPILKLSAFILYADMAPEVAFASLSRRLKLPLRAEKMLYAVLTYPKAVEPDMREQAQKEMIRALGAEAFRWLVLANWAYGDESITPKHPYAAMLKLSEQWQPPLFPISGKDLISLGVKPGKPMGKLLRRLETLWEKSGYRLTREELLAKLPKQ